MSNYRHQTTGRSELARRTPRGTTATDSPDSGPAPEVWSASQASGPDALPPGREPGVAVATCRSRSFHYSEDDRHA